MPENISKKQEEEDNLLMSFVLRTKEGKYAPIEETSIPFIRLAEEREINEASESEEGYYYSIS